MWGEAAREPLVIQGGEDRRGPESGSAQLTQQLAVQTRQASRDRLVLLRDVREQPGGVGVGHHAEADRCGRVLVRLGRSVPLELQGSRRLLGVLERGGVALEGKGCGRQSAQR